MNTMPRLSREQRKTVLHMLVEGMSMRAIRRVAEVHLDTITRLLIDAGKACLQFHNENVRNLRKTKRVEVDEIWAFIYAKQKRVPYLSKKAPPEAGDVWTWTALDADNKLLVSWVVGQRDLGSAYELMMDMAERIPHRIQLTTDGLQSYLPAVEDVFGADIDFAQIVKLYGPAKDTDEATTAARYSPPTCRGVRVNRVTGDPDPKRISTSYVERHNLTMRIGNRRFGRLTNAFSKRLVNHAYQVALFVTFYNWVRIHQTLEVTPAMAAGLTRELYDMDWLVGLVEARDSQPGPRGPYKREGRKKRSDAGKKRK